MNRLTKIVYYLINGQLKQAKKQNVTFAKKNSYTVNYTEQNNDELNEIENFYISLISEVFGNFQKHFLTPYVDARIGEERWTKSCLG